MDTQAITSLITSIGFPIVAYLLMFDQYNKVLQGVQKSINDNTLTIQKLIDKMDKDESTKKDGD